jgi:hypothetical protein
MVGHPWRVKGHGERLPSDNGLVCCKLERESKRRELVFVLVTYVLHRRVVLHDKARLVVAHRVEQDAPGNVPRVVKNVGIKLRLVDEAHDICSKNRVIHAVCRSPVECHHAPHNSVRAVRRAASGASPSHRVAVSRRAGDVDVSGRRRVPRARADAFAIDGDPGLELVKGGVVRVGNKSISGSRGVGEGCARVGAHLGDTRRNACTEEEKEEKRGAEKTTRKVCVRTRDNTITSTLPSCMPHTSAATLLLPGECVLDPHMLTTRE